MLSGESFRQGGLQRTSNARPGKLFTTNHDLMAAEVGLLKAEALRQVIAAWSTCSTMHLRYKRGGAHLRTRGEEAKALKQEAGFTAQRWVVECTYRWLNRSRRLLIRWDNKLQSYLRFRHLACVYLTYKSSGLLGSGLRPYGHSGLSGVAVHDPTHVVHC
jgi:hypothetical protein